MKQGYIQLLPHMLRFLAAIRKIVRYHDVTPGSQITWNTAFLAVTGAYKRSGEKGVQELIRVAELAAVTPEDQVDDVLREQRLDIYRDCNDAFRNLLLGRFGRLPLGFPEAWVYESAFGRSAYRSALASRTEGNRLVRLKGDESLMGQFVQARITGSNTWALYGEVEETKPHCSC